MTICFGDTSALAKRYVAETGTGWIRNLLDPAAGNVVILARITAVELIAAISRRERAGSLSPSDAAMARSDFRGDLADQYQLVEVDESVVNRAMLLAETYGLRGYDAVQLAAAVGVNAAYLAAGAPAITLLSADVELNAAAAVEGLAVEDPNTHP